MIDLRMSNDSNANIHKRAPEPGFRNT